MPALAPRPTIDEVDPKKGSKGSKGSKAGTKKSGTKKKPRPKPKRAPKPQTSRSSRPSRASRSTKSSTKSSASTKSKDVDVKSLKPDEVKKRITQIYMLERAVERKRAEYDIAKRAERAAKAALVESEETLEKEIREQRLGPGPLFNAKGDGPAEM